MNISSQPFKGAIPSVSYLIGERSDACSIFQHRPSVPANDKILIVRWMQSQTGPYGHDVRWHRGSRCCATKQKSHNRACMVAELVTSSAAVLLVFLPCSVSPSPLRIFASRLRHDCVDGEGVSANHSGGDLSNDGGTFAGHETH